MSKINRFSSTKFSYTPDDRTVFYRSFNKKLIQEIKLNNFIIEGYSTTCWISRSSGVVTNHIISSIFYRKVNNSGKKSNWLYKTSLTPLISKYFFEIFSKSEDYEFWSDINKKIKQDQYENEMKNNEVIIHNSKLRLAYKESLNTSNNSYSTSFNDDDDSEDDDYFDEITQITSQIRKLSNDIKNANSFEDTFPEKSIISDLKEQKYKLERKIN